MADHSLLVVPGPIGAEAGLGVLDGPNVEGRDGTRSVIVGGKKRPNCESEDDAGREKNYIEKMDMESDDKRNEIEGKKRDRDAG